MATKKAPAKRKPAAKKAPEFTASSVAFPVGAEVEVHPPATGEIEGPRGRAPLSAPLSKAKVKADGSVAVGVPAPGLYTLAAEVDGAWHYRKAVV